MFAAVRQMTQHGDQRIAAQTQQQRKQYWMLWVELLKHTFQVDVQCCPICHHSMQHIAELNTLEGIQEIIQSTRHTLPASVINPENLFLSVKRLDRERDDLILNHLALEHLRGKWTMNSKLDKMKSSKLINQRINVFCKALSDKLASEGWSPSMDTL